MTHQPDSTVTEPIERRWPIRGPYDLHATMKPLADGPGDPTWAFDTVGVGARVHRAMWTPEGAATVRVVSADGQLHSAAWGPGARWATDRVGRLCGLHDAASFPTAALHPVVADALGRSPGTRIGEGLVVADFIVPTVLGQRVTMAEARGSWRDLVDRHGHRAPGTDEVRLGPSPRTLVRLGDADWHRLGVERKRADTVRSLLARLAALQRAAGVAPGDLGTGPSPTAQRFREVLEGARGVGPWSSTSLAISVLGDPDVVLLGDLHLPNGICHALAGEERGSDDRMLELLEPFRPDRGRVVRLLKSSGRAAAPRRGPRYTPQPIRRM